MLRRSGLRSHGLDAPYHGAGPWAAVGIAILVTLGGAACGDAADNDDPCAPDDADGVIGGNIAFDLTVDDTGFAPTILAAQNTANVTLTLRNNGTTLHSFVIDCMPTPNINGCPTESCCPPATSSPPRAPGASATTTFTVPRPEGIHYYHSDVEGDTPGPCMAGMAGCGQFIVK